MSKARPPTSKSSPGPDPEIAAELSPLDPAYERPESELPVLGFPHTEDQQFRMAAEQRRRIRVRNEAIFVAILVVVGAAIWLAVRNPALLVMAFISAVAVAAYEVTVTSLE